MTSSCGSFTLMAKPTGPRCNLRCEYCFYLEKEQYFQSKKNILMTDEVLEAYIRQYIATNDNPEVVFAWQGGEPTMMGLEFFKKAVIMQRRYRNGKTISNTMQTNGVLLNDEWCRFLAANKFLIGLSLDGPREIHDRYRRDRTGKPTFDKTMQALERLNRHRIEYNILACITRKSAKHPNEVYRFFKQQGIKFIQFIPVVETCSSQTRTERCQPTITDSQPDMAVAPWSVQPDAYGDFLISVFDEWARQDVGKVYIMNFEWALASWMGAPHSSCSHAPHCGHALILEHNGDIYSCDHYMFPEFRLGNILTDDLAKLVCSEQQRDFGTSKKTSLPNLCRQCDLLFACHGGCLKYRIARASDGRPLNYLCSGTKRYLDHIKKCMYAMAESIRREIFFQERGADGGTEWR